MTDRDRILRNVACGAKLLDEKNPNWRAAVNAKRLNVCMVCNCILGQVFDLNDDSIESFSDQLDSLGIFGLAGQYGFDFDPGVDLSADTQCLILEDAWIKEIQRSPVNV